MRKFEFTDIETANSKIDISRFREWADYLRTPGLKQANGFLCSPDFESKCCLGHAEDVVGSHTKDREWRTRTKRSAEIFIGGEYSGEIVLSEQSQEWFGFVHQDPVLYIPKRLRKKARGVDIQEASVLNDDHKFTLKQIASCIDYTIKLIEQAHANEATDR